MNLKVVKDLILIFLFGVLFSCEKDTEINTTKDSVIKKNNGTGIINPQEFAKLHNDYLFQIIKSSDNNQKLDAYESAIKADIPELTTEDKVYIYGRFSEMSVDQMRDSTVKYFKTSLAKYYYDEIDSILEKSQNYITLSTKLDEIASKVNRDLVDSDWDIIMVYLETIRYSAYAWFPEEMGGSGIGFKYALKTRDYESRKLPNWVRADGVGAGMGMVGWSFSAFFGPVAPSGLLFGAVFGAVSSSISAK